MTKDAIAVSSPGKVLLAGGYLVVDRAYTGLVFGLNARIHVSIDVLQSEGSHQQNEVVVRSPQFRSPQLWTSIWYYKYDTAAAHDGGVAVENDDKCGIDSSPTPRNKFIETVLQYTMTYIAATSPKTLPQPVIVTIIADTAYYSHEDTATKFPLAPPSSPFSRFNVSLADAHKTGLGSSAALVTSLSSALLAYYLPDEPSLDLNTASGQRRAHNIAQLAHCSAQGKVGSGFDVAAAVYGSCEYRRFSPSVLEGLGSHGSPGFAARLVALVNDDEGKLWDTQVRSSISGKEGRMAAGLGLFMCDVDCGSETPGMVKKIFAWRESDKENADRIWEKLQAENERLAELLLEGKLEEGAEKRKASIRAKLNDCRALIREMSERSGVPVEPPAQTELLDACSSLPGVLGGVVPGAGGYDALVLVVEDNESVKAGLESFLSTYKPKNSDGGPQIGKVKLLNVKQEMQGVRKEDPSIYQGCH